MVRPKAIGDFIFIELDIPNRNDGTVVECQLAVMPKSLDLLDAQFRLAGMISSSTSHHTSYCWRPNNNWEFCDNRASSVAFAGQRTKIKASAAIYVKILPNDEHEPKKNVIHAENQFQSSPRLSATPPRISVISCTSSPPTIDLESPHNSGKLNQSCLLPQYKHSEDLRTTKRDSDTFSRDNWRNKGSPDLYWVEETDESTLIINDDGESFLNIPSKTETAEGYTNRILSPSGTMPDANEVNENSLCLTNTSIVDSITHILLIAALDDPHYLQSIEGSPDKLLRFIVSLKDQSLNDAIHADKTDLFMSLFSRKIQLSENGMCILDPHDSVSNLWEEALLNAPSVYKFFECQTCGPYVVPVWTINIDCELIYRQNFSVLQQALKFYPTLKKVPCIFEGCEQLCSIKCSANFHIFIDLEMKIRGRSQKTVQCKLGEIPKTLHLDMEYRLAGVIAHAEAGFVAYCYRVNESTARWELYGSCPKKNHPADPHDVVEPHGAIYLINYSFSGE
ncbi:uncharacterized protein [Fopius arisanus]|uniref:Uncharacterized protein n=2 Tax=Fopius arisanus TaxID=64838 RepID=A0A9R1UAU6_9HYME|nr:PREDICTED: uncharacterized protein LOC105273061 [Fopius arisanus]